MKCLLLTITIAIVLVLDISENNINAEPTSNSTVKMAQLKSTMEILPTPSEYNRPNFLTYIKSNGLDLVNQIYNFNNIFNKEISFVDIKKDTIVKKNLNETQLQLIYDIVLKKFSSLYENVIINNTDCANCNKYGLNCPFPIWICYMTYII